jgi:hypothetical protein
MMPFNHMLAIEPPNDDELFQSTNEDYEPNTGDKHSQLGDSATVAVLDGTVRAMMGVEIGRGPFFPHVARVWNLLPLLCFRCG